MAQFKLSNLFEYRNVTPSALQQNNLISFSYKSPNGVHDKNPLVYVLEKRLDRFYGINLHYDMDEMENLAQNTEDKIIRLLENSWYTKYPKKKAELKKNRQEFDTSLVEPKDLAEFKRKINKKDLETFLVNNQDTSAMRCYLYSRMNKVSKLVWKVQ